MKRKIFFAVLAVLSVMVLLSFTSCSNEEASSSSAESFAESSEVSADNTSLSSADDNTSELVSDAESNIVSTYDSSVAAEEVSSEEVSFEEASSVDKEGVYWVPDEFKELETGKAFAKINPDKGYRMDIKFTYDSGDLEGESTTGEGYIAQKGNNLRIHSNPTNVDEVTDIITIGDKTYYLEHNSKKFYEDYYYANYANYEKEILVNFFDGLKHQKTGEHEIDGQKYIVDIFLYEDEEDHEYSYEIQIFTQNGELRYIGNFEGLFEISVTYSVSDDIFAIPSDYTEKTIGDFSKELFYVPDELKDTKTGKVYSSLDVDKGFSYTVTNVGVDLTYMFLFKGDMAGAAIVDSPDDLNVTTIYRDKYCYNMYFDKTYSKTAYSFMFGFYEIDTLEDLTYVDTTQEIVNGVEYTAERFSDSWDDECIFYFLGDELVGREDFGDFEKIEIGFEVDESLFEIPSDYTETKTGTIFWD